MAWRRLENPDPRLVPTWPAEVIDGHPLAAELVGCYLPGVSLLDICDKGPPLIYRSNSTVATPLGPGTPYPGPDSNGILPAAYQFASSMTIHWRGMFRTNPDISDAFTIGGGSSPASNGIRILTVSATDNRLAIGGSGFQFGAASGPASFTGSFAFGGSLKTYTNGSLVTSSTAPASTVYSGCSVYFDRYVENVNSSSNTVSIAGLLFGRAVSADEAAWLNAEPFAMLRPKMRRTFVFVPSASITGLGVGLFGALSASGIGNLSIAGSGAGAFGGLSAASSGTLTISGSGAGAFGGLSAASSGTLTISGSGAGVFGALSAEGREQTAILPSEILSSGPRIRTIAGRGRVRTV